MNNNYIIPIIGALTGLLLGLFLAWHSTTISNDFEKVIYNDKNYTCQSRSQSLMNYTCITPEGDKFDLIGDKIIIRQ